MSLIQRLHMERDFLLDDFKTIESEYFDKDGRAYTNQSGSRKGDKNLELMRALIYKQQEIIDYYDNEWYSR